MDKCDCGGELEPVFRDSYVKDGCAFDGPAEDYIGDKCVECDREYKED